MSELWETIREAIATQLAGAGPKAAGLRSADTRTEDVLAPPCAKVLWPYLDGDLVRLNANQEEYDLIVPVEVLVPRPSGRTRSSPATSAIVRAIQVAWRTGPPRLGLNNESGVQDSYIDGVTPALDEYEETGLDGARILVRVKVCETFNPGRTS